MVTANQPAQLPKDKTPASTEDTAKYSVWHHRLALLVIVPALVLIAAIAVLIFSVSEDKSAASQLVVTAILPLLGAWVGAVIAFYFSSKNLEAATTSVTTMLGKASPQERLKSIATGEKMIRILDMFYVESGDDKITLNDMLDRLDASKKGDRIPVLDSQKRPRYVVHRSVIDKFLANNVKALAADKAKADADKAKAVDSLCTLTVKDLVESRPELKHLFGLIAEDSTLADVKRVMDGIPGCQDVFVTRNASEREEVAGWVTNVIVEDNSRL